MEPLTSPQWRVICLLLEYSGSIRKPPLYKLSLALPSLDPGLSCRHHPFHQGILIRFIRFLNQGIIIVCHLPCRVRFARVSKQHRQVPALRSLQREGGCVSSEPSHRWAKFAPSRICFGIFTVLGPSSGLETREAPVPF